MNNNRSNTKTQDHSQTELVTNPYNLSCTSNLAKNCFSDGLLAFLVHQFSLMGDQPKTARSSAASADDDNLPSRPPTPPPAPPRQPVSLLQPSQKKKHKSAKVFRVFGSVFRSFPIITPATCKLPSLPGGRLPGDHHRTISGSRITGTLFGYRKGRVSLSMQENPRCLPTLVVELAIQTNVLQKDMSSGMLRIALECEKKPENGKSSLLEEPMWTMYVNGKKSGYGVKRDANEEDLNVMELLRPVSAGAGVLPGNAEVEGPDNELTYIRAHFERVVGSRDSETLYMLSPEGNNGPELTIFFVRIG